MSRRERDVLKVMSGVLEGRRSQVEAARLLGKSTRQVRRMVHRLKSEGDGAVVHRLRGRRSNRCLDASVKARALSLCRTTYAGFGPTLASEKLAERDGIGVSVRTLGGWMSAAGLWERKRRRDKHRSWRERRACFGEMIQADASEHDWLEGRGPRIVLAGMIDDASSRAKLRFYEAETTEAYMDLLGRWVSKHGRPVSWYSDRDSVFVGQNDEGEVTATQFSRALSELDIGLISAYSPQAKGRVERLWSTAQDRLVKELRLAKASTMKQANRVLEKVFEPWFNREKSVVPKSANDAHRTLGKEHDLASILSVKEERTVTNDYTIRFEKKTWQLLPPAWPGQRGGKVTVERRLDGSMAVRFKKRYLEFRACPTGPRRLPSGALPPNPRLVNLPRRGGSCGTGTNSWKPAATHAWREPLRQRPREADISICRK